MDLSQVLLFVFGCSAIWLVARKEHWKRWGYIAGMCGQPFWFYTTITSEQWGMFALTLFYTYSWGMGIYNYWMNSGKAQNIDASENTLPIDDVINWAIDNDHMETDYTKDELIEMYKECH